MKWNFNDRNVIQKWPNVVFMCRRVTIGGTWSQYALNFLPLLFRGTDFHFNFTFQTCGQVFNTFHLCKVDSEQILNSELKKVFNFELHITTESFYICLWHANSTSVIKCFCSVFFLRSWFLKFIKFKSSVAMTCPHDTCNT